jgi:hypothetical protein
VTLTPPEGLRSAAPRGRAGEFTAQMIGAM